MRPVGALESERQTALDQRVRTEKALVGRALDARRHRQRAAQVRADAPPARRAGARAARDDLASAGSTSRRWRCKADQLVRRPSPAPASSWTRSSRRCPSDADVGGLGKGASPTSTRSCAASSRSTWPRSRNTPKQRSARTYLDAQDADLTTALETLEDAIRKIDRETRGRFKETFDRVNAGVQELYPRLFGGGHAYLELTGEDLLDTGVSIMARPPGKRVSNISLLSGGEKALTAVALVFAIFRLNPAPFCLLDEVDAPLDEANVGRFTAMVSEMSEQVQFLFVTHNKATMEAAQQLCGVTMREPGVSRLVSVDLAEAARLAGAA